MTEQELKTLREVNESGGFKLGVFDLTLLIESLLDEIDRLKTLIPAEEKTTLTNEQ